MKDSGIQIPLSGLAKMKENAVIVLKLVLFVVVCLLALFGVSYLFSGWLAFGFSAIVVLYMVFGADEITTALRFRNWIWPKLDLFNKEKTKEEAN